MNFKLSVRVIEMNYDDVIHHHSNEHHNSHSFAMISSLSHRDGLTNVLLNYHRKWIFILQKKMVVEGKDIYF